MSVLMKSRMSLNSGYFGSNTRSVGQIKEIPCGGSRGHISCSNDLKIGQNVCPYEISHEFKFGSPGVFKKKKKKVIRSNQRNTLLAPRGHISCSIDLNLGQNVCIDGISDKFEFGSPWVKILGHLVKLKKYLVDALNATFLAQLT